MALTITIKVDLEDYFITEQEVLELSAVIADSYREAGAYVASFGFLTYQVVRKEESVEVIVVEGYGFHSHYGGIDNHSC